jgi:hypothetical protein
VTASFVILPKFPLPVFVSIVGVMTAPLPLLPAPWSILMVTLAT